MDKRRLDKEWMDGWMDEFLIMDGCLIDGRMFNHGWMDI